MRNKIGKWIISFLFIVTTVACVWRFKWQKRDVVEPSPTVQVAGGGDWLETLRPNIPTHSNRVAIQQEPLEKKKTWEMRVVEDPKKPFLVKPGEIVKYFIPKDHSTLFDPREAKCGATFPESTPEGFWVLFENKENLEREPKDIKVWIAKKSS